MTWGDTIQRRTPTGRIAVESIRGTQLRRASIIRWIALSDAFDRSDAIHLPTTWMSPTAGGAAAIQSFLLPPRTVHGTVRKVWRDWPLVMHRK